MLKGRKQAPPPVQQLRPAAKNVDCDNCAIFQLDNCHFHRRFRVLVGTLQEEVRQSGIKARFALTVQACPTYLAVRQAGAGAGANVEADGTPTVMPTNGMPTTAAVEETT